MKIIRLALLLTALTVMMTACNDDDPAPYMELSQKQIDLKADGGDFALTVNSNVKYVVNHACEWLRITNSTTLGDATTLDISVEPNTDLEGRSARIKFIGENVTPKAFEIRQSGYIPTGVSVTSLKAESGDTSVEFDVLGEGAWSAISSNPDYVLSVSSGVGNTHVIVSFPANTSQDDIMTVITVTIDGEEYEVLLNHTGMRLTGVIAEWPINKLLNNITSTWGTRELDNKAGFIDAFIVPATGTGTISYYSCDKSGYDIKAYACYVQTGGKGDPIFKACIKGDYWLIKGGLASGEQVPAGRRIKFEYTASITKDCCPYWIVEYLDGTDWYPAIETKTTTLSATTGISNNPASYSETVTYNYKFEGASIYTLVAGEFTLNNPAKEVQLRLRPVGETNIAGLYIDQLTTNCSSRFSAQHPHENGAAVKKYEQSVKIEFAD